MNIRKGRGKSVDNLDWEAAKKRLDEMTEAYKSLGPEGAYGYYYVILPLRIRFGNHERSKELYYEIMALE